MLKMSIHNGLVVSYDDPELRPEGKRWGGVDVTFLKIQS